MKPVTGGDAPIGGSNKPATGGDAPTEPATGGRAKRALRRPLWDNGFFYIPDNEGNPDCKIIAHEAWCGARPIGLGSTGKSKTMTPRHYGETRDQPTRTWFLLRAWMVWRARQDGWQAQFSDRNSVFKAEAARLQADLVRHQPQADGLLGNQKASKLFIDWVPDIACRVRAAAF